MKMEESQQNLKKEFLTRDEIKILIAVILFTAGVVAPFWSVKIDVATIKTELIAQNKNQELEIKRLDGNITRLEKKDESQDAVSISLMSKISDLKK